jgi:predicted MFS family arabinose efflux permease
VHPGTRFAGPFLGGLLMAQVRVSTGDPLLGPAALFYLTAFGYVVNAFFLYLIRLEPIALERAKTSVFRDMAEGVKFIAVNPIFSALILMTYCTQFFGWSFQSVFPIFAKDIFDGGELEIGLMGSVLGAGSLIGATVASNLSHVQKRGLLLIGGFVSAASLIVVFAGAPDFRFALGLLFVIGVTQAIFNVTAQSTLQYLVPNEFRGRVMGIWGMTHTTVMPLGQLQVGLVAGIFSAPIAVAVGGLAMLVYAGLLVLPNARVRNLTLAVHEHETEAALTRLRR